MSRAPWQPARLLEIDVRRLTWLLLLLASIRALDYLTGEDGKVARAASPPPTPKPALVGIENAFPLWVWGASLALGCAAMLVGLLGRRHFPIWLGHLILSALYIGLTVGLGVGYLERPWFDGIRTAAGLAFPAALHCLLWWRMGPRPVAAALGTEGTRE